MKTCIFLALIVTFLIVTLIPAAPPAAQTCRNCKVAPAQSDYTAYKPPATFYPSQNAGDTQHVHHRRINRVDIVQVLQVNPAYSSQYSEYTVDSTTQSDILAELKRLGLRSDQIAAMLFAAARAGVPAAPGAAPAGPPAPATYPAPGAAPAVVPGAAPVPAQPTIRPQGQGSGAIGLAVMNAKCAQCHQAGKLSPDQRFTLLDAKGQLATLTPLQKLRVLTKTYSGQMPPPTNVFGVPGITDAEYAALMDLVMQ